ncbi:hypothetical protein CE91St48_25140 [Emergencia timonensis]|nr:hypothetical protein CE91St48_25140 [Emergencia timonensis]
MLRHTLVFYERESKERENKEKIIDENSGCGFDLDHGPIDCECIWCCSDKTDDIRKKCSGDGC